MPARPYHQHQAVVFETSSLTSITRVADIFVHHPVQVRCCCIPLAGIFCINVEYHRRAIVSGSIDMGHV